MQLYLRLGLKLKKIHCVLEFNQSQWIKPYIEFNTRKTIEAEKNGDKDGKALYKLMNNAVYGETMEKLRNRINLKLKRNQEDYLKWTWKPSWRLHKIFDSDLVTIRKNKVLLMLNVRSSLLIITNMIKNKYGNNSKLFFTDTDSVTYEIETEDFYKDSRNNKEMFDFRLSQISVIIQGN